MDTAICTTTNGGQAAGLTACSERPTSTTLGYLAGTTCPACKAAVRAHRKARRAA